MASQAAKGTFDSVGMGEGGTIRTAGDIAGATPEGFLATMGNLGGKLVKGISDAAAKVPAVNIGLLGAKVGGLVSNSVAHKFADETTAAAGYATQEGRDRVATALADPTAHPIEAARYGASQAVSDYGKKQQEFYAGELHKDAPAMERQNKEVQDAEGFWNTVATSLANPLSLTSTVAQSFPDMAAGMGISRAAMLGKQILSTPVGKQALAAGEEAFQKTILDAAGNPATFADASKLAAAARQQAIKDTLKANQGALEGIAGGAGLIAESVQSGGNTRQAVQDFVSQRPDMELQRDNATYRDLRIHHSEEEAKAMLGDQLGNQAAGSSALWTGAMGKVSGAADAWGHTIGGGKVTGKQALTGTLKEGGQEMLQNPGEDFAKYEAQVQADPTQKFDLGGSMAQGLMGGVAQGGGMHGTGYVASRSRTDPTEPAVLLAGRPVTGYTDAQLKQYSESGVLTAPVKEKVDAEIARRAQPGAAPAQGDALDTAVDKYAAGLPGEGKPGPADAGGAGAGVAGAGQAGGLDPARVARDRATLPAQGDGLPGQAGAPAVGSIIPKPATTQGTLDAIEEQAAEARRQAAADVESRQETDRKAALRGGDPAQPNPLDNLANADAAQRSAGVRLVVADHGGSATSGVSHLESARTRNDASLVSGRASLAKLGGSVPDLQPIQDRGLFRRASAVADAIESVTGSRPVLYHDTRSGAADGFEHNGVAYVNAGNLEQSLQHTVFHETFHVAERRARQGDASAQQFVKTAESIFDMISQEGRKAYAEKYLFKHQLENGAMTAEEALAHPKLKSEMIADFFGQRGNDAKFIRHLAQRSPEHFGGFARRWIDSLTNMIQQLRGSRGSYGAKDIDQYIQKLSHAKAVAASALIQWRRDNPRFASNLPAPGETHRPANARQARLDDLLSDDTHAAVTGYKQSAKQTYDVLEPGARTRAEAQLAPQLKLAEEAKPEFDRRLINIANQLGGEAQTPPVKGMQRAAVRLVVDHKGDNLKTTDLLRGSVVVPSLSDIPAAMRAVGANFPVVRTKDRFTTPTNDGYRDVLMNVRMPNGLVAEVQIHTPETAAARQAGHGIYEDARAHRAAGNEAAAAPLDDLTRQLHGQAYQKALGGAAPAFSTKQYPMAPAGTRYEEHAKAPTMMSPDEFLSQVRPLDIDEASRDNIDDLKRHIESGGKLDPLHIRKDGKEDGRHRAVASRELGIKLVPVIDEREATSFSDKQDPGTEDGAPQPAWEAPKHSRAGEVTDNARYQSGARKGQYIGAPAKYNTPAKIPTLRRAFLNLAREGEAGRFWYENSGHAVLQMTFNDRAEARRFIALLAIYSPQAKVDANTTMALRAWAQYKAGVPIDTKTADLDAKADAILYKGQQWEGEKTNNFFRNLLRQVDEQSGSKDQQGVTVDMWMMRAAGYDKDSPTDANYLFVENETNRLAKELGWEPQQVQAAIWVAMKARLENAEVKAATEKESTRKGYMHYEDKVDPETGKTKQVRVVDDEVKHRRVWLKHAMALAVSEGDTQRAKFDFSDGLRRHLGQISWEAKPGRPTGILPGIHTASYQQQAEFQKAAAEAMTGPHGEDLLAQKLGLLRDGQVAAPGVWQSDVGAGMQYMVPMIPLKGAKQGQFGVAPEVAKNLNVYAATLGLLFRQDGVGWHRPFFTATGPKANAVDVRIGRPLTPEEASSLWTEVDKELRAAGLPDWEKNAALVSSPQGMRLIQFGIMDNVAFYKAMTKAVDRAFPGDIDVKLGKFASVGDMPTNDWKVHQNGEDYASRIAEAGRSDVLGFARDVLAPRVQALFEDFSQRYGWGDPGQLSFSGKQRDAGDGSGRDQGGSLAPLPGAPAVQGAAGPDPRLTGVAHAYAAERGIQLRRQAEYVQVDPERAARIAAAYDAMPHAPNDPRVKAAYADLIQQTTDQFHALEKAGYKFTFFDGATDPYKGNPWNAMRDLRANKRMAVYGTYDGYGTEGVTKGMIEDNPMLADTGMRWPDQKGVMHPVLANDLFRAVHDAFGHGLEGAGFRAQGEENAWQAHARMFTGDAVGAITSETRGQNSWLNYGPYGEKNRTAKVKDTVFADQKTGLMPEWTWTEGSVGDEGGINESRKQPPVPNGHLQTDLPEEGKIQAGRRVVQDQHLRMRQLREWATENGARLTPASDAYATEERMHGRMASKIEDFREKTIKPLVEKTQAAGFTMDQVAEVLHAEHARERNEQVAKINPKMPDAGSGMATADARAILARTTPELRQLARQWQAITIASRDVLLKAGIISQDMADRWDATYKHYVPLKGGDEESAARTGTGQGLSVNGKQKRAMGHNAREEHIVENILQDYERSVMLAEKNRVGQSMMLWLTEMNDPRVGTVSQPVKRATLMPTASYDVRGVGLSVATFDTRAEADKFIRQQIAANSPGAKRLNVVKTLGDPTVQYRSRPQLEENEAMVYVKGHAIRMQLVDPLLAQSYKKLNADGMNRLIAISRAFQTYLSRAYTGYNPAFIVRNMIRDFGSGTIKLTGNFGAGTTAKIIGKYPGALASMLRYSMTGKSTPAIDGYRANGGSTGAAWLSDMERIGLNIQHDFERYQGVMAQVKQGKPGAAARVAARKVVGSLVGWIEHLNAATENAMRLATYQEILKETGSPEQAASAAKNSTVNFNRKGEKTSTLAALYLFFNPSVQDTASVVETMTRGAHKEQAWALCAAMTTLAFTAAALQFGGDDDAYEEWKKLSDYTRDKNLVIRIGKGKYVTIPVPFGFGFFHTLGNSLFMMSKGESANSLSVGVAANILDHFSPVGNPINGAKTWGTINGKGLVELTPGLVGGDLFRDLFRWAIANRTSLGGDIVPDSKFDEGRPNFLRENRSTKGTAFDAVSRGLSDATGGTPTQGGKVDISPETLKFWFGAISGGTGTFISDAFALAGLGVRAAVAPAGEDISSLKPEMHEIPIAKDYVRESGVKDARRAFWEASNEAKLAIADLKRATKAGDEVGAERVYNEKGEILHLAGLQKSLGKMISAQRDQVEAINADKTTSLAFKRAAVARLEKEETEIYDDFLRAATEAGHATEARKAAGR
jgi:hypothetical protein